jgi:hypothetical protein
MVDSSVMRAVSLYFFLSVPDEKKAHTASLMALSKIRRLPTTKNKSLIIHVLHGLKSKAPKLRVHHWPFKKEEKAWVVSEALDLQAWWSFTARADQVESEAVLLSRVLGFTDSEIAAGLGVTDGTVRYRVGRGLRVLGGLAGT